MNDDELLDRFTPRLHSVIQIKVFKEDPPSFDNACHLTKCIYHLEQLAKDCDLPSPRHLHMSHRNCLNLHGSNSGGGGKHEVPMYIDNMQGKRHI